MQIPCLEEVLKYLHQSLFYKAMKISFLNQFEAALRLSPLSEVSFSAKMEGDTDGDVWLVSSSGLTEVVVAEVEMTEVTEVTKVGRCVFLGQRFR